MTDPGSCAIALTILFVLLVYLGTTLELRGPKAGSPLWARFGLWLLASLHGVLAYALLIDLLAGTTPGHG